MIPWANFDYGSRDDASGDIRIQLHEHWLAWVEHGPSMTTFFLESPMLEIAHERQFVVSQQGWDSAGFESEHTRRMQECLRQLEDHFHNFGTKDQYCPRTLCDFDVMHCWKPELSTDSLPPFSLSDRPTLDPGHNDGQQDLISSSPLLTTSNIIDSRPVPGKSMSGLEIDPDDQTEEEVEVPKLSSFISSLPIHRAGTKLPIHGARASKIARQRKQYDSRLKLEHAVAGKKRSSQWMASEGDEEGNIAKRAQSASRLDMIPNTP